MQLTNNKLVALFNIYNCYNHVEVRSEYKRERKQPIIYLLTNKTKLSAVIYHNH